MFRPGEALSWPILLDAALRAREKEIGYLSELKGLGLSELKGIKLSGNIRNRIIYTALKDGLIDDSFDMAYLPARGETIKMLCEVFNIRVNKKAWKSSFEDISGDDDLTPYIIAAKRAGILADFRGKMFNPDEIITREIFANWLSNAYSIREDQLSQQKPRSSAPRIHPQQQSFLEHFISTVVDYLES